MTDAWRCYITVGREFAGGHERVDHGAGEYVRGSAHVNTAESFFAPLKRGIVGSFHHVSPEHLHRYCDESMSSRFGGIIGRQRTRTGQRSLSSRPKGSG